MKLIYKTLRKFWRSHQLSSVSSKGQKTYDAETAIEIASAQVDEDTVRNEVRRLAQYSSLPPIDEELRDLIEKKPEKREYAIRWGLL